MAQNDIVEMHVTYPEAVLGCVRGRATLVVGSLAVGDSDCGRSELVKREIVCGASGVIK